MDDELLIIDLDHQRVSGRTTKKRFRKQMEELQQAFNKGELL